MVGELIKEDVRWAHGEEKKSGKGVNKGEESFM